MHLRLEHLHREIAHASAVGSVEQEVKWVFNRFCNFTMKVDVPREHLSYGNTLQQCGTMEVLVMQLRSRQGGGVCTQHSRARKRWSHK